MNGRTLAGLGVTVAIAVLFEIEQTILWYSQGIEITELTLKSRFVEEFEWFLAVAVGAVVARKGFVIPAISLAVLWWLVSVTISHQVTPHDLPSWTFFDSLVGWLPVLPVDVIVTWGGAVLGCWFSGRERRHVEGLRNE